MRAAIRRWLLIVLLVQLVVITNSLYTQPTLASAAKSSTLTASANPTVPTPLPNVSLDTKIVVDVHLAPIGQSIQKPTGAAPRAQFSAQSGPSITIARTSVDTIGTYRPSQHAFYLQDVNQGPYGYTVIPFGTGNVYPIVGDWNGDGVDTIGVYDQNQGIFSLRDSNSSGTPDYNFVFGTLGDQPLSGRWSAQVTHDGIGIFRPSNGAIYLRNSLNAGGGNYVMILGNPGDVGVAGDWAGLGYDTVGVYRPTSATFYLADQDPIGRQNCNCNPSASKSPVLGYPNMQPLSGNWAGSSHDGIGVYDASTNVQFNLKDDPTTGFAEHVFNYGVAGDIPVAGHWGNVYGVFYQGTNNTSFTANTGSTAYFKEGFPNIVFNPNPSLGQYPPNSPATGMPTIYTTPLTDVVVDGNGNYAGLMLAQDGQLVKSAGLPSLNWFNTAFTGYLSVTDQGIGSLTFYHDAGFILGIGQSSVTGLVPQPSQGPNVGSPGNTPFLHFPVMAADNENQGGPISQTVTVYFPAAGTYPFELDYFQANGSLTLNLATSFSLATPTPLPTFTYTPSNTPLPTVTPTFTPTFTYTPSMTPLPTATPTFTPTFTYTPSMTPLPTATPTFTPTFTYTPSITPPPTATATFTASVTLTPTITLTSSKTNTALFKCQNTPTPNAGSPTSTPIPCNTVTPSPTLTPSFTKTPSLTMTPSITRTPSITPLNTATSTKTLTATPNLPPGVTCIDWHLGAQGWVSSPWMASGVSVQWDTNGLHGSAATNLGTKTAGAYFQLPPGGPYKVAFSTNSQSSYILAQGSVAPSTLPLTQVITAQNSVYLATQPFIELQWSIQTPVVVASTLQFYSFCYISANPTATVPFTATSTLSPTPLATITQTPTPSKTPIYQANGLNVYVAYADDQHATSPNFPVPWFDSPNVIFKGYIPPTTPWVGKYDSGAIRIENPTNKTVTVHNVTVSFPNHPNMFNRPPAPDYSFSLPSWGVDTDILPGQSLILTETLDANPVTTTQFTFDTSDYTTGTSAISGQTYIDCKTPARPDDSPPRVVITMKDGTFSTLYDSAHILDTGGVDIGSDACGKQNEGRQWQAIGVVGGSGTYLILNTSNSSPVIGTSITLTAHLTDASGSLPASGVPVMFYVTGGGPNQGAIYNSTTNAQGYALYTYSSASYGPDTITARITNVTGSVLSSNSVTVNWMYPITPTVTPTPQATNTPAMTPTNLPTPPVIMVPGCITSPITPANNLTQISQPTDVKINTTLTNASVDYWPVDNPGLDVVLKTSFLASSGAILTSFDPTTVADGSYAIRVQGTDSSNKVQQCGTIVSVVGNYKPGRVKFTINDFTLPVAGLPITISRTYDSLQRNRVGDFGFGWSLAISSPQITVDPAHNVTLTLADGKRKTFYFAPQVTLIFTASRYQAEAGTHGQLSSNCGTISLSGGQYTCLDYGGPYQPTAYTYTDAYGRVFVYSFGIDATGTQRSALTSMTDVQGNKLVYAPNGITYTNARSGMQLGITWIRDNLGRIAQITTPADGLGNTYTYLYTYDSVTGDLASVTYPPVGNVNPKLGYQYYDTTKCPVCAHLFRYATDPQNTSQIIVDDYYLQTDGILQGRLKGESRSLTGADDSSLYPPQSLLTYGYSYPNLTDPTNYPNPTTKVTNPDGGQVTITYDTYGMVLHKVETVGTGHTRGVTYTYYDTTDPSKTHLLNTEIVDGMASGKSYGYDANGFQNFVKDENGYVTSSIYNKYGGMSSKTDPERYTTGVTYGSGFDTYLPKAVSASKDATSLPYGGYDWNTDGTIAVRRDGAGNQTTYSYDQYGNLASEKDPGYQATNYQYDNLGRLQTAQTSIPVGMSAPAGRTDYTHDGMGHVTGVTTHPDANTAYTYSYGYDLNGNKTDEWDPRSTGAHSYHTQYVYDAANHLWKIIYPNSDGSDGTSDSNKVTYSYNWRGQKTRSVDQASNLTCYQYDQVGRLTMTTYGLIYGNTCPSVSAATPTPTATPTGVIGPVASVTYTYDDANRKTSETDGRGYTTTYSYDLNGNLLSVNHPVVSNPTQTYAFERYGYYQNGWRKSATDAGKLGGDSMTTLYTYNPRGQVVLTQYGGNSNEQHCYDNSGNSTQVIDQNGESTYYQYQNGSQLVSVVKPFVKPASQCNSPIPTPNQTTGYQYDTQGNLQVITDANGHQTSFNYDALGRQIQKTWPAASGNSAIAYETFGYDAVGNMTSHQLSDDKSHINIYQFDALNRETRVSYFDGHSDQFNYTGTGKRWNVSIDNNPYETYSYDSRDRLTLIQSANGQQAVSYAYDQNNNRIQLTVQTYGSANTTNYAYDPDNRLKNVTNPTLLGASATISYDYYLNNLRQDLKYPNGVTTNYTYDAYNHLNVINQANSAGLIANYQYTLDTVGNRTSVAENNGSTATNINWCYDAAMRLTGEGRNTGCQPGPFTPTPTITKTNYVYDSVGNRLSKTTDNQPTSYNYNSLDQLTSDGSSTYTYDGRGNQQTVTGAGVVTTYGWNAADQPISLTKTGAPALSASYAYDADGRRRQQNINATTTNYLWDEASQYGDVVAETDGSNVLQASYVLGGIELLAQNRSNILSYYLLDGQNSIRALTNGTGMVTDAYAYDAYGNLYANGTSGSTFNPYRYTNQQNDITSGLYNLRARNYNPQNGIFISRDSKFAAIYNPSKLNRYIYAIDNPINVTDPSGHDGLYAYSQENANSEEESAAADSLGKGTVELYGRDLASEEVLQAKSLYANYIESGDPLTIGKGTYTDINSNIHEFVGTNDLYGGKGLELLKEITKPGGLRDSVSEFIPGNWYAPANEGNVLHVEFKAIQYIESKIDILPDNALVTFGISNPSGICPPCQAALVGEYGAYEVGGDYIITLERGIKIILAAG